MKSLFSIVLLSFFFTSFAQAECNYEVAKSASQYLNELEKANLRKYQNSSVCEVLANEAGKCSKKQIKELNKSANLDKALGSYCEVYRRSVASDAEKGKWTRGAELLSWQDKKGIYWFSLLPGTDRLKDTKEILKNRMCESEARNAIAALPAQTKVIWNNVVAVKDRKDLEFIYPPETVAKTIRHEADRANVKLEMQ